MRAKVVLADGRLLVPGRFIVKRGKRVWRAAYPLCLRRTEGPANRRSGRRERRGEGKPDPRVRKG